MIEIRCKFYAFRHRFLIGNKRKTLPPCLGAHPNPTSERTSTSVSGQYDVRYQRYSKLSKLRFGNFSKSFQPYQACVTVLHTASKLSLLDTSLFTLWHKQTVSNCTICRIGAKGRSDRVEQLYRETFAWTGLTQSTIVGTRRLRLFP